MTDYLKAILISFCLYSAFYLGISAAMFKNQIAISFVVLSIVSGILTKKVADFMKK